MNKISKTELHLKCHELIGKAQNIIITTHINPDGDAAGSALAIYLYLESLGKRPTVIINGPVPFNIEFLPGIELLHIYNPSIDDELISKADLSFIVDLNDSKRIGRAGDMIMMSNSTKILIDHHVAPRINAELNIVESTASSTGELIWDLLKSSDSFVLTPDIALLLYTAIMTDTGNFRFQSTSPKVHRIAAELLESGIDPSDIYDKIYNTIPATTMKLYGLAFSGLETICNGKAAIVTITDKIMKQTGAVEEDIENFVENILTVKGVVIGSLISEIPERNEIRISFRSKGDLSIRELAVLLNGGGHKNAAGARVFNSTIEDVKKKIIEEIGKILG